MSGPAKMPHDPLEAGSQGLPAEGLSSRLRFEDQRAELVELDALISILGTCACTLQHGLEQLLKGRSLPSLALGI